MKQIFNNTLSNYILKALQITLNLIAIPILIQNMGLEGFGIILFAGVLVGYFSILEMGVAQAVTKYIATKLYRDLIGKKMLKPSSINTPVTLEHINLS